MLLNDYIERHSPTSTNRHRKNPAYPIFSDEDSDLNRLQWHMKPNGYACRSINLKIDGKYKYFGALAHRVVLERMLHRELKPSEIADHYNRNRLDCRRSNLSLVTSQMNNQNRSRAKNNTSGYKGVVYYKDKSSWVGRFKVAGKWHVTKCCKTSEEANKLLIEMKIRIGFHEFHREGQ